jgi:hypothetical protein
MYKRLLIVIAVPLGIALYLTAFILWPHLMFWASITGAICTPSALLAWHEFPAFAQEIKTGWTHLVHWIRNGSEPKEEETATEGVTA